MVDVIYRNGRGCFCFSKSVSQDSHNKIMGFHWTTSNSKKAIETGEQHYCGATGYRYLNLSFFLFKILISNIR